MNELPPQEVNRRQGFALNPQERERMDFDVVIVGAGPAGLAAAIRLRQLAQQHDTDLSVCVLEKGAEVGAHILSGAVIDPVGLDALLPDWKDKGAPLKTPVAKEQFLWLTQKKAWRLPNICLPPLMKNHGNFIASLGTLCRWLGAQAEQIGVDVFSGFAAAEVLLRDDGSVAGVATGDMGIAKDGQKKSTYTPGVEIHGKYTFFAEGARGSLSKFLIHHFALDKDSQPQKYGIGLKELWQVPPQNHRPGTVQHSLGWPLDNSTGGGSFLYHFDDNLVSVGFVVHLDYTNPHISPFDEFQRFKTHPAIRRVLEGGERIGYGARAITEGGWQSVPRLTFPGGALLGCAAGFVNVPRIKGSHNAMLSGLMAAEAAFRALQHGRHADELLEYAQAYENSSVSAELKNVRNVKPLLARRGTRLGTCLAGLDMWMRTLKLGLPFTLKHQKTDAQSLKPAAHSAPIPYPKPDGKLTFDRLSSVFLSGTRHEEDQPVHLTLQNPTIPVNENLPRYEEPAQRYCPAGVYEILYEDPNTPRFQINAQNCVHCKTCDIKDPATNINWVTPEGGGGPAYSNM